MSAYSFTKLFSSITESTIWCEPHATVRVWIAMLAKCDRHGCIQASVPGFARLANVTLAECEAAIATLLAPDPYSRTPDNEGRRIETIPGGWRLLNHAKYRDMRDEEARRTQNREAQQRHRQRLKGADVSAESADSQTEVSDTPPESAHADADADAKPLSDSSSPLPAAGAAAVGVFEGHANPQQAVIHPATAAAIALRKAGLNVTGANPDLIAAVEEGVTVQHLLDTAAIYPGKPAVYVIRAARRERSASAAPVAAGGGAAAPGYVPSKHRDAKDVIAESKPARPASPETATRAFGSIMAELGGRFAEEPAA